MLLWYLKDTASLLFGVEEHVVVGAVLVNLLDSNLILQLSAFQKAL